MTTEERAFANNWISEYNALISFLKQCSFHTLQSYEKEKVYEMEGKIEGIRKCISTLLKVGLMDHE